MLYRLSYPVIVSTYIFFLYFRNAFYFAEAIAMITRTQDEVAMRLWEMMRAGLLLFFWKHAVMSFGFSEKHLASKASVPSDPITQKQMQMMRTPWNPESHAGNILFHKHTKK